jgi:hypothetical protein
MPRKRARHHSLTRRIIGQAVLLALSFLYLCLAAFMMLFGFIVGWDINPGQPLIGALMILAGIAVFVLGPRVIKRLTGRAPIDPPPYV